jgi:prepilin-type N-terminal cleavage/methylation domain-containing protein
MEPKSHGFAFTEWVVALAILGILARIVITAGLEAYRNPTGQFCCFRAGRLA